MRVKKTYSLRETTLKKLEEMVKKYSIPESYIIDDAIDNYYDYKMKDEILFKLNKLTEQKEKEGK